METGGLSKAAIAGFLITAITVIILPIVVVPANFRSEYFWIKILWTEYLAIIVWCYIGWAPTVISLSSKQEKGQEAAVVPGVGVVIFFYVGVSLFFLLSSAYAPDNEWLSRFQLARQIISTLIFFVICIGFYKVAKTANQDNISAPPDVKTPEQLAVELRAEESRIQNITGEALEIKQFAQTYKSLREKINYSLPSINNIGNDPQYADFISQVNDLVNSVQRCEDAASLKQAELREKAANLISQIDIISARFNR